jgi:hypothetical protein
VIGSRPCLPIRPFFVTVAAPLVSRGFLMPSLRDLSAVIPALAVLVDAETPPLAGGSVLESLERRVAAANALLAAAGVVQETSVDHLDLEDWAEAACRYAYAARFAKKREFALISEIASVNSKTIDLRAFTTREESFFGAPANLIAAARSTPYATTDTYARHAGRRFVVCRNDEEDDRLAAYPTLSEGIGMAREWPSSQLAWKQIDGRPKAYPIAFMPNDGSLSRSVGFNAYAAGGRSLLQERVKMTFETRFFVIDGEVISGAGAVERRTPFERDDKTTTGLVDHMFECVRNSGRERAFPTLAADLEAAARTIAPEFAADFGFGDFVLDLFINGETGDIGVIETNPISASGFYANDASMIVTKLAEALATRVAAQIAAFG